MTNIRHNRIYENPNDIHAKTLLTSLLESNIPAKKYQKNMYDIGVHLGNKLKNTLDKNKTFCIVSTAEDADFLAKGILESLEKDIPAIYLTCFWNDRISVNGSNVAPIYNKYFESGYKKSDELIVVKSIISGSCVVKTNVTALIDTITPKAIHVVSPVMHVDSDAKLEKEFPLSISKLFKYIFLAKDSEFLKNGEMVPGIGGSIYEKLGFKNQQDKNTFIPEIVKRKMFSRSHH
jgi:hypothetical protein|tara:strand:+ start:23461 stop:24162 length:702 start_codon:yes stop_codon:yes gene_type:complete